MKKKRFPKTLATALLLCGGLTIGNLTVHAEGVVPIDEAHFPDPCFRQYIQKYMDYNKDTFLDDDELIYVESIELSSSKEDLNAGNVVHNLEGLQYFPNLYCIILYQQSLDSWDFSKWPELTSIHIWDCPVTNLDFSKNNKLLAISILDTPLVNLDISECPALDYLWCQNNKLTQLDISNNPALDYLELKERQLTSIDISNCPKLIKLYNEIQPTSMMVGDTPEDGEILTHSKSDEASDSTYLLSYYRGVQIITEPSKSSNDTSSDIPAEGFQDVPSDAWYKDAVKFVSEKGIMNGTSDTTFVPLKVLTRAEFVTVLHNMAGKPEMEYKDTFTDVAKKTWYTNPVMWAFENKVTSGISENEFGPDIKITREQLATMLLNYYGTSKLQINDTAISNFPDKDNVSDWAIEGVKWAVSNGIISGKPSDNGNILDPKGEATRAECAQMIMNLMSKLEN